MKKSTFSKPSDYTLPQVVSSKSKERKSTGLRAFSNLLRGYDNSHSSNRRKASNDKLKEDNKWLLSLD